MLYESLEQVHMQVEVLSKEVAWSGRDGKEDMLNFQWRGERQVCRLSTSGVKPTNLRLTEEDIG